MFERIIPQDADVAFAFEAEAMPGAFSVLNLVGEEALFEGYEIVVDLVSEDPSLDLAALLDTPAVLSLLHAYEQPRFLHGVIVEIERRSLTFRRTLYRATLKPSLHRLHYQSDNRIFQAQSVPDIAKSILADHQITDVEWRIEGVHEPREFCVQYQETSYDFLRRLWAEEGIFFWFEHSATSHKMIVSDAPLAMPMLPGLSTFPFNNLPGGIGQGPRIWRFDRIERLRATHRAVRDYSFLSPAQSLEERAVQTKANGAKAEYELYAWPGRHKSAETGRAFNDYALEAHRVEAAIAEGETNSVRLSAGYGFTLMEHPDPAANTNHRILRVIHEGHQASAMQEEAATDKGTTYRARFTTQPAHLPYRPVNPNPRPRIDGPQIAHVTGPEGEEIYCDEHGRVKVWFPWDRKGKKDETSSCWIRVSQNWAGGGWGHMAIPRVGNEVVVEFLDGDPDQPIITGRTYHAANRPPYSLSENKTRMTIKSQTHKGEGFNELSFEDKAGGEQVYLHAQRNHDTVIGNDETHSITRNRSKTVGNDQSETIRNNKSISVGNDHSENITGNQSITVGKDRFEHVKQDARIMVDNDVFYEVKRNQIEDYGKDHVHRVGNILKEAIKFDHLYETEGKYEAKVHGTYDMEVKTSMKVTTNVYDLSGAIKIEIIGPNGKILLDPAGITLDAPNIYFRGKVNVASATATQLEVLKFAAKEGLPLCEECEKQSETTTTGDASFG
ncbi:MAG: type VI secretion system tip protein VgrG [Rhizobiaceae bacterium]|nr:type VI secretion system tip protein VgrG [Rhizobiaceae bacterium]